tara:strand:+ start:1605 stop:2630 length:1026 start_codon:yes stop_codon:yes gene_type:complete
VTLAAVKDVEEERKANKATFNEAFTNDVLDHKLRKVEGGLGEREYSDPEHEDDPVRGAELWVEFLNEHPEYYIPAAEIALVERATHEIPNIIPEPVILCFLGIGNDDIFRQKDIKLTSVFNKVIAAATYDLSRQYLTTSMPVMEENLPDNTPYSTNRIDFFTKGFTVPRPNDQKDAVAVATMFGGTIVNAPVERDKNDNLLTPEKSIRSHFKAVRGSLKKGDFFIVTQDANTDAKKIEAAYAGQTRFASNLAHAIKRDTPFKEIDTENTAFRVEFDKNSGILAHYLTLDFRNGDNGPQEMLINSSPKVAQETFKDWAKKEKFDTVKTFEENGVCLHIMQAI